MFNALTGKNQGVGNWPGKTIEKKTGKLRNNDIEIVDLPGTYSISAFSAEEVIAREFIIKEKPDAVINIIDGSNLERNLYLTVQLLELGANVVIALNMMDIARSKGFEISIEKLSKILSVPVVPIIANKEKGIDELIEKTLGIINRPRTKKLKINYRKISKNSKDSIELEMANIRYEYITGIVKKVVNKKEVSKTSNSDKLDNILTNKWLGIPLFLLFTYVLYQVVFSVGAPFVEFIQDILVVLTNNTKEILLTYNLPNWVTSLITSGIMQGVGNVLVFLPNIALLFFVIAFLEDSGYMARVAFVMDRLMRAIGLQGKSFISLVIAFGCSVPAIMATRTIENQRDRVVTILINSLIPCSARIAVFGFIAGAFFVPDLAAQVVWSMVVISFTLVVLMSWLFKLLFPSKEASLFVIELPPYQLPSIKGLIIHTWLRTKMFIKKAGSFIVLATIVLWFLASNPSGAVYGSEESYIGQLGHLLSPVFSPLEIDWKGTVALISGFFAKEIVISSFAVLYGAEDIGLQQTLSTEWTALQAYVFMIFTLLYIPCLATVTVIKNETGSWKWTLFAIAYTLVLAWIMAFIVLQIGHFLGY